MCFPLAGTRKTLIAANPHQVNDSSAGTREFLLTANPHRVLNSAGFEMRQPLEAVKETERNSEQETIHAVALATNGVDCAANLNDGLWPNGDSRWIGDCPGLGWTHPRFEAGDHDERLGLRADELLRRHGERQYELGSTVVMIPAHPLHDTVIGEAQTAETTSKTASGMNETPDQNPSALSKFIFKKRTMRDEKKRNETPQAEL
jgi:hypothetical protein